MPFTDDDLRELLHRLRTDPEARREIYEILHAPALQRIEDELRELAAAQRRTDEHLASLAEHAGRQGARMEQLTARVDQLAGQMQALTARVDQLAEQMRALTERVDQLAEQMRLLTERVDQLATNMSRLTDRVGGLVGESLERRYRDRAGAYFGSVLRKTRVLEAGALEEALDERLSPAEMRDTLLTDVVVSGKPRSLPQVEEVWLAVEVSSVVDAEDVHRAVRRSRLLRRGGRKAVPVVAGERIDPSARDRAKEAHVVVLEDGTISNWDEALEAALNAA